jgi:hypothetical protein
LFLEAPLTFGADTEAIEDWGKHWTIERLATYERLLVRLLRLPWVPSRVSPISALPARSWARITSNLN